MSIWYAVPSKRPPEEANPVLRMWTERGYHVALWVDEKDPDKECEFALTDDVYPGYAEAVNRLCKVLLASDARAEWIVTGGDDVEPDPDHSAEEIARECYAYFACLHKVPTGNPLSSFGVMQCTGDRWGDSRGALIDRICGSPWMGREFCRRIYGGKGPLWPEFTHMFVDEHLQRVAQKLGILWQRPDLRHHHRHFMREPGTDKFASSFAIPEHLKSVCTGQHWNESLAIFRRLEGNDFKEAFDLLP